ncbi:MAG: MFS transporter [Cyclobacteriaceae bacterium]|nr:MFS transporter [Cyclobacteriaceae bacterium]
MEKKTSQRVALSVFFFLSGLCYSSWASRIPTIKESLNINEAELGSLLFIMPISSLVGLPISGWLVSRFDSRWPLFIGFLFHAMALFMIGNSTSIPFLMGSMVFFAFFMRIFNIAMNTQSITLQKVYEKKINGSFHGLWSLGGIVGVGITTLMIALNVNIHIHLLSIAALHFSDEPCFFQVPHSSR